MKKNLLIIMCNLSLLSAVISLSQYSLLNNHQPQLSDNLKKRINGECERKYL